jgi:hypothetical protein
MMTQTTKRISKEGWDGQIELQMSADSGDRLRASHVIRKVVK